ncbi:transcriptional attenuator, LytR family [Klenkia soli]|uniref:Transcriptional attenuator, LytR family n=1 Tax=Klenkia soli TaxID=1052260 RepID=A0A1H0UAX5_9ACTN|nr:transcriptional attenuator, LytR family [Klenkia soli]
MATSAPAVADPVVAVPVERRPLPPAAPAAATAAAPAVPESSPLPPRPVPAPVPQPPVPQSPVPQSPAAVAAPATSELPASGIVAGPTTSAVPAQTAGPRPTLPPVPVAPPAETDRPAPVTRTSAPVPPLPGTERAQRHSAPVPPLPGTERGARPSAPVPPLPGLRPSAPLPPIPGLDVPVAKPAPTRAERRAAMSPLRRRLGRSAVAIGVLVGLVGAFYVGLYFYADRSTDRVAALTPGAPEVLAPQLQVDETTWLVLGTGGPGAEGPGAVTTQLLRVADDGDSAVLLDVPPTALVDTPECRTPDGDLRQPVTEPLADALLQGGPSCLVRAVQQLSGLRVDHLLDVDLGAGQAAGSAACPTDALPVADLAMLANPVRAASVLLDAAGDLTLDHDTTLADLRSLGATLRDLPAGALQRTSVPVARVGYVPTGGTTAQVLLDGAGNRDLFDAVIRTGALPEVADDAAATTAATTVAPEADASVTLAPSAVTLTVLDATGDTTDPTTGAGATAAAALQAQGFVVGQVALEPARVATSVVRYAPEAVEQARTVAAAVPAAVLEPSDAVGGGVQLVVAAPDLAVQPVAVGAAVPTTSAPATAPTATCG